jgi:hypothetical protein
MCKIAKINAQLMCLWPWQHLIDRKNAIKPLDAADLPKVLTTVVQHHSDNDPGRDGVGGFVRRQRAFAVHIAYEENILNIPIGRQLGCLLHQRIEPGSLRTYSRLQNERATEHTESTE